MSEGSDTRGGGHPFRPKPKERVKPPASAEELLERYQAGERASGLMVTCSTRAAASSTSRSRKHEPATAKSAGAMP